jgi:hypothetical protein
MNNGTMPELAAQLQLPFAQVPMTAHLLFAQDPVVISTVTVALPSDVAYVKVSLPMNPSFEMYLTESSPVALATITTLPPC